MVLCGGGLRAGWGAGWVRVGQSPVGDAHGAGSLHSAEDNDDDNDANVCGSELPYRTVASYRRVAAGGLHIRHRSHAQTFRRGAIRADHCRQPRPGLRDVGAPVIGIVSSTGAVLKVHSEAAGQWCQFSCDAPPPLILARGAVVFAAMHWMPSYCGPDPGSSVRLRLALPHSTVITIPVRNLGGAAKPIYAPSCTPALGETRLSVERFGYHQG